MADRRDKRWFGTVSKCIMKTTQKGVNYWKFTLQADGFGYIPCKIWGNTIDFEDGDIIEPEVFFPNSYSFTGQDGLKKYVIEIIIREWDVISEDKHPTKTAQFSQGTTAKPVAQEVRSDKVEWDDEDGESIRETELAKPETERNVYPHVDEPTVNIDDELKAFRAAQLPTEAELREKAAGKISPVELDAYIAYMKQKGKCQ